MEATYQEHRAPRYTYFVDRPNISILCSKYECLIIPEFFPFNLQTEQSGVEPPVLLQSDEHTLGEEHQIILQVHVVLFSHQFPSAFQDPIYTVQINFWMDKNLHRSNFCLNRTNGTGHLFDMIRNWSTCLAGLVPLLCRLMLTPEQLTRPQSSLSCLYSLIIY